jgi:hypothetical protein
MFSGLFRAIKPYSTLRNRRCWVAAARHSSKTTAIRLCAKISEKLKAIQVCESPRKDKKVSGGLSEQKKRRSLGLWAFAFRHPPL